MANDGCLIPLFHLSTRLEKHCTYSSCKDFKVELQREINEIIEFVFKLLPISMQSRGMAERHLRPPGHAWFHVETKSLKRYFVLAGLDEYFHLRSGADQAHLSQHHVDQLR